MIAPSISGLITLLLVSVNLTIYAKVRTNGAMVPSLLPWLELARDISNMLHDPSYDG